MRNRPASKRGAVFIIVLWIATGLVTVALLFGQSMMFAYRVSDNAVNAAKSEQAIEGAERYIEYILENTGEKGQLPGVSDYLNEGVQIGDTYYWIIGRSPETSTARSEPTFGLIDEGSKLNLNTATQEMLENLPGMTPQLAAAIVDWRDEDDDVSENGAEANTYAMHKPSYECKNAPFETVAELRLVYNADYDIVFGEDINRNGLLDPNENDGLETLPNDDGDGMLDYGLVEYLTVYTRQPNASGEEESESSSDSDESSLVNVNGGDDQALTDLLNEYFDEDRVSEITARVGGNQQDTNSVLQFYIQSGMTAEEFQKIENRITTSDDEVLIGLVNVNTAPAEVLACIPGIDESQARQLVAKRSGMSQDTPSLAWVADVLEEEEAIEAGPYLTAHSYQFTVDIAACNERGGGFRRTRFVIDMSEGEAEVIYRHDMTGEGWALGEILRSDMKQRQERV